jgi:protein phosphatase
VIVAAKTNKGLVREKNEDCFFIDNIEYKLFVVADGMGGHKAGEVASREAVKKVKEVLFKKNEAEEDEVLKLIEKAFDEANSLIFELSSSNGEYDGMGTTLTLAYVFDEFIYIGHIGDSRAYILDESELKQITTDHTLVEELIKSGTLERSKAKDHPNKNVITKAVGVSSKIEFDLFKLNKDGLNKVLLCSDGLTDSLNDDEIKEILLKKGEINEIVNDLIEASNEKGGHDNITAIVFTFDKENGKVEKQ